MWIRLLTFFLLVGVLTSEESRKNGKSMRERHARQAGDNGGSNCPVSLPQISSGNCKNYREKELAVQKGIYQLALRPPLPMPLVNMSIQQLVAVHQMDEFKRGQFLGYVGMLKRNKGFTKQWKAQHPEEITEFQEYENIFKEFRSKLGGSGSTGPYRFVTNVEPFRDILKDWREDDMFAEQRLSGCNPMVIRRVTDDSSDVGLKWSELSKTLNPNYNWEGAIQTAMASDEPLQEAIKNGNVYVLRYEVFDDMVSFPDMAEDRPGRTMWPTKSPIALFAVNQDKRLRAAAIQIDYKPDSPVFSPVDGGSWMMARLAVQATDYAHSQMIEHLLKLHLLGEPFCVVLYRQLSSLHPLNELLKFHCRGLIATNTIGSPSLVTPHGYMDQLTAMGHKGTLLLLDRGYKTLSWNDADFYHDIKKRGVDNKEKLPYYPYRDDSKLLFMTIKRMVEDYICIFYRGDQDVKEDKELQAFVNEVSAKGTGPDGGRGQVKDFPARLETKDEVIDVVSRLIWLLSVKHAAVNYPVSDYGAFTPVLPTKVYNDSTVPPGTFSVLNLPNVNISLAQIEVAMNVGTYHYDELFDYSEQLNNPTARQVVRFYYYYLKYAISPRLKFRNYRRFRDGHLTYPYLQHSWLPNGIQT
ncbi:polyunsaturated fatty acid 5-lipoxygenase-like [Oculina patagonica]